MIYNSNLSHWQQKKLGSLVEHKKGFAFKSQDYQNTGYPIVRVTNFTDRSINLKTCNYLSDLKAIEYKSYKLYYKDIIIATVGSWPNNPASVVGKTVRVPKEADGALLNQNAVLLRSKSDVDQDFLFYRLKSVDFLHHLVAGAQGSANQASITLEGIFNFAFRLPPLPEQQAIAHILGSLDDKIELNRQMNETLEGIAHALFKSWFVDFDSVRAKMEGRQPYGMDTETAALFPDGFEDSALGEIPRGWRVAKFTDFIKIFKKSVIPNQQLNEIFDHYSIPAFDKERLPTFERGEQIKSNKFLVPEGAILLSKINPTIPRVWFPFIGANEHRSICSTEFLVILPKETISSEFLYTLFSTNGFQERFIALTTGSSNSHQRVGSNELLNMILLIPNLKLIEHFTEVARPLYIMMNQNLGESKTLTTLRDTFLPKLLSGELRVGEAEKEVGAML